MPVVAQAPPRLAWKPAPRPADLDRVELSAPTAPARPARLPAAEALHDLIPGPVGLALLSATRSPGRPSEEALAFIDRFHRGLGLEGEGLEEKERHMKKSPHNFLRDTAALFVEDVLGPHHPLELLPRPAPELTVAVDVHLQNFGIVRGSDGKPVWGLNDFDQADRSTPELDLARLATSLVLQVRQAELDPGISLEAIQALCQSYRDELEQAPGEGAFLRASESEGPVEALFEKVDPDRWTFLRDLTEETEDGLRFVRDESMREASPEEREQVQAGLRDYEQRLDPLAPLDRPLEVKDIVQRWGSGGATLGLPRWYALVEGEEAPYVLEIKQLLPTPLVDRTGDLTRADAAATVASQEALGGRLNPLTGYAPVAGYSMLVREREPEKASLGFKDLNSEEELLSIMRQCGQVLARSHAPTPEQAEGLRAWLGEDQELLSANLHRFAARYADQAVADWQAFKSR